jgi:hypothetical protein
MSDKSEKAYIEVGSSTIQGDVVQRHPDGKITISTGKYKFTGKEVRNE